MKNETKTETINWYPDQFRISRGADDRGNLTARADSLYSSLVPTGNEDGAALTTKQVSFNDRQWYIIADNSDGNGEGTVLYFFLDH